MRARVCFCVCSCVCLFVRCVCICVNTCVLVRVCVSVREEKRARAHVCASECVHTCLYNSTGRKTRGSVVCQMTTRMMSTSKRPLVISNRRLSLMICQNRSKVLIDYVCCAKTLHLIGRLISHSLNQSMKWRVVEI